MSETNRMAIQGFHDTSKFGRSFKVQANLDSLSNFKPTDKCNTCRHPRYGIATKKPSPAAFNDLSHACTGSLGTSYGTASYRDLKFSTKDRARIMTKFYTLESDTGEESCRAEAARA